MNSKTTTKLGQKRIQKLTRDLFGLGIEHELKITPKRLQKDVENDVRHRASFEGRIRLDFLELGRANDLASGVPVGREKRRVVLIN